MGLVVLAVSLVVLAPGVDSLVAVLVACVLAGLANGLLYSGATAIVATMAPPHRASGTAAAVYSAFYLGAGLPTLLVGVLTTALPLDTALSATALGALALTALMIVLSTVDSRRARTPARHVPGGRYRISWARSIACIVSSTVSNTVVSYLLSAPPPEIARATAAIDTLSGASQRL